MENKDYILRELKSQLNYYNKKADKLNLYKNYSKSVNRNKAYNENTEINQKVEEYKQWLIDNKELLDELANQ